MKDLKNVDQIIKDSSHRSIKKMQLFLGGDYWDGTENLGYLFKK